VNTQEYIESGILETYLMGSTTDAETRELLHFKDRYPEIENALKELEQDMEHIAGRMAIMPPPGMWKKISDNIDDLITTPKERPLRLIPGGEEPHNNFDTNERSSYIEVESESTHIRVSKTWKYVLIAVFVLSKIFLISAIYFYLENRQAQQQIQELKTELRKVK
jgi:hypothetical protein